MQALLNILVLDAWGANEANWKEEEEEEEASFKSPKQIVHSTSTLGLTLDFLAMYGKQACIHELSITLKGKKIK